MPMELPDGLGEHRSAKLTFLDESLRLSEPASVASGAVVDGNGMDHSVAVEQVVAGGRLKQGVGAVPEIDTIDAAGDGAGDREGVADRLFRNRSEVPGDLYSRVGGFGKGVLQLA